MPPQEQEVTLHSLPSSADLDIDLDIEQDSDSIIIYDEDSEDFKVLKQPRYARISALLLGLLTLAAVGCGIYFFLDHNDYTYRSVEGLVENADQQVVALLSVQDHVEPEDCWIALHGKVYDMTDYAPIHPGASSLITMHCGTDATRWFDFEHSVALLPIVDPFMLGMLVVEEEEEFVEEEEVGAASSSSSVTTSFSTSSTTSNSEEEEVDLVEAVEATTNRPSQAPVQPATTSTSTVETAVESLPVTVNTTPAPTPTPQPTPKPTAEPSQLPPLIIPNGYCPMDVFTITDLSQHNDEDSCWYGLYGVVYDLTWYIDAHKGGRGTILMYCGTDATTAFGLEKKHDVDLLIKKGFASSIIGRLGNQSEGGVQYVPCEEVELVAVTVNAN